MKILTLLIILSATSTVNAQHLEKDYTKHLSLSLNFQEEVILVDDSRVDLLSGTHAYEVEFAHKWKEAIGQALFYSMMTNRKPGIFLIVGQGDERYVLRLAMVCRRYDIQFNVIDKTTMKFNQPLDIPCLRLNDGFAPNPLLVPGDPFPVR